MNKRTMSALMALTLAGGLLAACSSTPSATPASETRVCAAISGLRGDAQTDPVAVALAGAAERAGVAYQSASGQGAAEELVGAGCTLIVGADSTLASSLSNAARAHTRTRFALVGSSFVDSADQPTSVANGSVVDVRATQGTYLAGYAAAGMTTTGMVAVVGGARDALTSSQMDAFSQGVDAYNMANGTSIQVLGWNSSTRDGTFAQDAEGVREATAAFIAQGADIIAPFADASNEGASRAVSESSNPLIRLVWSGLTREQLRGLSRDEAQSTEEVAPMSGQSGAQENTQPDTASFADAFSYVQINDETKERIGAPVLTGVVVDYSHAMESLIAQVSTQDASARIPVSLNDGGVILTGFGAYTPMLSSELKLRLSDMAGQIETGGLVISTPFDVAS